MRKSSILFFVLWSLLVVFIVSSELYACYFPIQSLQNELRCLAAEFHKMCEKEALVYWIIGGTLLGSVRHGDIIKHDDDIDLAIKLKDMEKLKTVVTQYHMQLEPSPVTTGIWRIRKAGNRGIIDLFPVEEHENRYAFVGNARLKYPNETFDVDDSFDTPYPLGKYYSKLEPSTFVELVLMGPKAASNRSYLANAYGSAWFTPTITHFSTFSGFQETVYYSVCILLIALGLLLVQIRQLSLLQMVPN